MPAAGTDLLIVERSGTLYKAAASEVVDLGLSRFAATIGDGSATSFNIDHDLGTLDVLVQVVRVSDGLTMIADVTRPTTNRVTVEFAVAPTSNQYRVIVIG